MSFEVNLEHPCSFTSITASKIADQTLYEWNQSLPDSLSLSTTFQPFICDVTNTLGVSCGTFTYVMTVDDMTSDSIDPVQSLTVDSANSSIELVLDKTQLTYGLEATITITGTLDNYPLLSHSESFQLKVYKLECLAEQTNYKYQVAS